MTNWTTADIPPQHGRTAVVTGTGGIGLQTAIGLARAGADVVVAGRDPGKGAAAIARIQEETGATTARFEPLDLASLASVRAFADRVGDAPRGIDVLVNNAAVMTPPQRRTTADGFELQLGTNHLGHVALTAGLLPALRRTPSPRVVSLSSVAARRGAIDFDDLQAERAYRPMPVYAQSKLACLLFAFELQRRSDAGAWGITSVAAHPGVSRTELIPNGAGSRSAAALARRLLWFVFQPAAAGAWPSLLAATAPDARPGGYYGPARLRETRGRPVPASVPPAAADDQVARRLWDVSVELTGARF